MFTFIKNLFIANKQSRRSAVSSCRKLHLESLENRELLSVNPLYYNGNVTSPYEITNSSITATLNDAASVTLYAKFTTPSDLSGFNYILTHDGTSNQSDELFLRIRDGKIQFGAWHNPSNELVEYEVLANQEYTVLGVFDDANNSNSLKLYVNSANNPVSGYSGVDIADIKNYTSFSPKWYVGRHGTPADQRIFSGNIAEVAVYNTVLTGTDIDGLFQKDDWKISSAITDTTALEPCTWISGAERHGAYRIDCTAVVGKSVPDRAFDIEVEITLGGTATPGNNGSTGDYHLTLNPNGGVASDMITIFGNKAVVTIPAGQDYLDIYIMPNGDSVFEGDETVTLEVTKAYLASTNSSFALHRLEVGTASNDMITIRQAPEFLSDTDEYSVGEYVINQDIFALGFKYGKPADGTVVIETLPSMGNYGVVYSIVSGNGDGLYAIDSSTGAITFTGIPGLAYEGGTLEVKVADSVLSELYDTATVSFVFGWVDFVICVDQPVPGSRDLIALNNDVGHTFWHISVSKGLSDSDLIQGVFQPYLNESWGYYPAGSIGRMGSSGFVTTAPGQILQDNVPSIHPTDVYRVYGISSLDHLISLLQFTYDTQTAPGTYHIASNNCTTVAIAAAEAAGITIPATVRTETIWRRWIFYYNFYGYNPGDLGEDLMLNGGSRGQYTP